MDNNKAVAATFTRNCVSPGDLITYSMTGTGSTDVNFKITNNSSLDIELLTMVVDWDNHGAEDSMENIFFGSQPQSDLERNVDPRDQIYRHILWINGRQASAGSSPKAPLPPFALNSATKSIQPIFGRSLTAMCAPVDGGKTSEKDMKALKSLIALAWILSLVFLCLPVQLGQAVSGPGAAVNSAATYDFNLLEPFQSGFLINRELTLPITIKNTGSSVDQYSVTCTKESGGDDWSASLVNNLGQIFANTCLDGSLLYPASPRRREPDCLYRVCKLPFRHPSAIIYALTSPLPRGTTPISLPVCSGRGR